MEWIQKLRLRVLAGHYKNPMRNNQDRRMPQLVLPEGRIHCQRALTLHNIGDLMVRPASILFKVLREQILHHIMKWV